MMCTAVENNSSAAAAALGNGDGDDSSIIETLQIMRRQEENYYHAHNYVHSSKVVPEANTAMSAAATTPQLLSDRPVDSDCRFRMVEWCYKIVDSLDLNRETVAIAFSCLDRFICSSSSASCEGQPSNIRHDRKLYQLATMSALYTSIKMNEKEIMSPKDMAGLSRGAFNKEQLEAMELRILNALQWRVHPPTAISFLEIFLSLVPNTMLNPEAKDTINELSKFQIEVSISYADLVGVNASTIALASLLNSLDCFDFDDRQLSSVQCTLSNAARIVSRSQRFNDVRIRLFEALTGTPIKDYGNNSNDSHQSAYPHRDNMFTITEEEPASPKQRSSRTNYTVASPTSVVSAFTL